MRSYAAIRCIAPAIAGLIVATAHQSVSRAADDSVWMTDVASAAKLSRKEDRPLLIHFYATWCQPCLRMERETFAAKEFGKQIAGRFVLVRVNADRQPGLVRKYGVTGLPSDIFVSSNGRILSRNAGYLSKRDYFSQLARWESRFVKQSKVRIAAASPKQDSRQPAGQKHDDAKPAATKNPLIGMDGYSPVAMHRSRKWLAGRKQFAATHHGVQYWLADADELEAFRREPGRFAPRLLGCDPVILNEADRAVPGKVRYGAIFDGELFFFTSAENRTKFRRDPLHYTRTRHVLRVDDINGKVLR